MIKRLSPLGLLISLCCALPASGLLTGCITESADGATRAPRGMRTQGIIVNDTVEPTWQRVRSIVSSMTSEPLRSNGPARSIKTTIRGAETTVLVEARDARSTAVHINSENNAVADSISFELRR